MSHSSIRLALIWELFANSIKFLMKEVFRLKAGIKGRTSRVVFDINTEVHD